MYPYTELVSQSTLLLDTIDDRSLEHLEDNMLSVNQTDSIRYSSNLTKPKKTTTGPRKRNLLSMHQANWFRSIFC